MPGRRPASVPSNLHEMWRRYREDRDAAAHERLVLAYLPLVRRLARRAANRLPTHARVEEDDLVSAGVLGLMTAIDRFDPARGVRFETFATTRVNGAILDALRAHDSLPRSIRTCARTVMKAEAQLANELHRTPTQAELANRLDLPLHELRRIIDRVFTSTVATLDGRRVAAENGSNGLAVYETIRDPSAPDPALEAAANEARAELSDAITSLSKRERFVIWLYYHEGLTLREIGELLDVTESRACQIHGKATRKLEARLARDTVEAVAA